VTQRKLRLTDRPARPAPWGDRPAVDDDEARARLLDAAESCYERRGVGRTTVDDIAKEAAVHRTTVYRYFGTRDDVLAFMMLRDTEGVIAVAESALERDGPFGDRLLDALDGALSIVEGSRWLSMLFSLESLTMAVSASASGAFRDRIRDVLRPHVEAAKTHGELRADLNPDATADGLVRVAQMLLMERVAGVQEKTTDRRAVFRDFVIPGLINSNRRI
jgi:AcrR family transcriptional regulator